MRQQLVYSLMVLASALAAKCEIVAKICDPSDRDKCQYLFANGFVKFGRTPDPEKAIALGPYMPEYRRLISPGEAAVKELVSPGGWRVIVTRGFETEYRLAGSIFYLYFFDPHGVRRMKASGDLFLEDARIGALFGSPTEFLAVCMRGETGISYVTQVWVLPKRGSPTQALAEGGVLDSVVLGEPGRPKGLYIVYPSRERGGTAERVFWRWDESRKKLTRD